MKRFPVERWQRLDVTVRDAPLAVLMFGAAMAPWLHGFGTQIGSVPDRPFDAWGALVVALQTLPLVVRRRLPLVCLVLVSAGFAAEQLLGFHTVAGTAFAFGLASAGAHLERCRWVVAGALCVGGVLFIVALGVRTGTEPISDFFVLFTACAGVWGIGSWLRSTRAAEAEHRFQVAEATRTAERARIARELHDVVTHHVTAMVVQTEAARYLAGSPERLDATLAAVTDTGRRAITDLRHLLDLLNPDHGVDTRTPSAGDLHTLVNEVRTAGQPVELTEKGRPADSSGSAELVAFRVVQEALTNALKYDHGGRTAVRMSYGTRDIGVEVRTDGSGASTASPGGSGRGLAGLRERVDVLGGEFSAGASGEGGFVVRARIPAGNRA
ncbi:sensor histidine kinase [Cryptosporangium sp. NPDC048952]|uniref:sensor histidine kinase n=1 Tax=Cryptosporangium sp. NPDC048952 TaxID=3363961 RepID=UPI00371054B7